MKIGELSKQGGKCLMDSIMLSEINWGISAFIYVFNALL